jgi:hypothetical protein
MIAALERSRDVSVRMEWNLKLSSTDTGRRDESGCGSESVDKLECRARSPDRIR